MVKDIIDIGYIDEMGFVFPSMIADIKRKYNQNEIKEFKYIHDIDGSLSEGTLHIETNDYLFIMKLKNITARMQKDIFLYMQIVKELNTKQEEN